MPSIGSSYVARAARAITDLTGLSYDEELAERALDASGYPDEIERLREKIRDMKSLMPIVIGNAEQIVKWADEEVSAS